MENWERYHTIVYLYMKKYWFDIITKFVSIIQYILKRSNSLSLIQFIKQYKFMNITRLLKYPS